MNPARLLVIFVSLPLLLGGCIGIKREVEVPHEIQEALKSDP